MKENNLKSFSNLKSDQIQNLMQCIAVCTACAHKCVQEGHKKTAVICHECAEVCDLALKLKCTGSEFSDQVLDLCADVCKKCAAECQKMQVQHCKECGDVCNTCSESCSSAEERAS